MGGKQTCPKAMEIPLLCLASRGVVRIQILHDKYLPWRCIHPCLFFAPLLVDIFDSISLIGQYYWSLPALWTRDFYLPAPLLLMPRYWRLRPERPNSPQGQWPPEPCTSISWGWLRGRGDLLQHPFTVAEAMDLDALCVFNLQGAGCKVYFSRAYLS